MKRLLPALAGVAALCIAAAVSAGPPFPGADPPVPDASPGYEDRLARAELLAGLTAVEGPGLIVRLRHSPKAPPRGVDPKTLRVQEQDVNAVLNALRAGGAEALAAGGAGAGLERIAVGTAAREHGVGLMVNGAFIAPPYQIHAIGERPRLRQELLRADGVVKKTGLDVLQMIEVEDAELLVLPAARPAELRFARVSTAEPPTLGDAFPNPAPAPAPAPGAVSGVVRRPPPIPQMPPAPMARPVEKPTPAPPITPVVEKPAPPPLKPVAEKPAPPPEKPAVEKPVAGGSRVFGGRGLAKYHQPGCRYGERIQPGDRVFFATPQEAAGKGRSPCAVCLPAP